MISTRIVCKLNYHIIPDISVITKTRYENVRLRGKNLVFSSRVYEQLSIGNFFVYINKQCFACQ